MERVSCLCLYGELRILLSLDQFPIYDPLCFRYCENFPRVASTWDFWRSTSSVTSSSLSTTTFSVTSLALSSLSSSAAHLRSSKWQCVQVPTVNCFLYTFIPFKFHLQFVTPFWIFWLQFHLCCPIPLSSVHSYKLSHGFIHKETGNTTRCLAMLCELNKDMLWPVTDQLWKKWCDWLPIMTHIINLHSDS